MFEVDRGYYSSTTRNQQVMMTEAPYFGDVLFLKNKNIEEWSKLNNLGMCKQDCASLFLQGLVRKKSI